MSSDVLVATCTLGQVRAEWALAYKGATAPTGRKQMLTLVEGYPTAHARNVTVQSAIDAGVEILFFWDDDVIPLDQGAYTRIISDLSQLPQATALGGVYPRRTDAAEPLVLEEEHGGAWWGWTDGKIHKVHMTGTGFLALRVADLAEIDVQQYEADDGQRFRMFFNSYTDVTDDFWFAAVLREAGKSWYVDGSAVCEQVNLDGYRYRIREAVVA